MSKRNYYGSPGGTRNPFGSSGKKPQPEKAPKLPTCYDQVRQGIATAAANDQSNTDLPNEWRAIAKVLHAEYRAA